MARIEDLKKQVKHAQKKGLFGELVILYQSIGEHYARRENHEEAIEAYVEALRISETHLRDDLVMQACASRKVGEAYMSFDKLGKALQYTAKYKDLAVRSGDRFEEQRAYTTVGRVLLRLAESHENNSERAEPHLQAAETAFSKSLALCKLLLADLGRESDSNVSDTSRGDKSAGTTREGKLKEVRVMYARSLLNLALVFEMRSQLERALEFARRSLVVAVRFAFDAAASASADESETYLYALVNVARIQLALGRYAVASRSAQQLEVAARARRDRVMRRDALRLRADVALRAERDFGVAFRLLRRAASGETAESDTTLDTLRHILHSEAVLAQRSVDLRGTIGRVLASFERFDSFEFDPDMDVNRTDVTLDAEDLHLCGLTDLDYALSFDWLVDAESDSLDASDAICVAQHFENVGDSLCELSMFRESIAAYVAALRRRAALDRTFDSLNHSRASANRRKMAALLFSVGQSLRDVHANAAAAAFFNVLLAFTARHPNDCTSSWHPAEIRLLIGDALHDAAKPARAVVAYRRALSLLHQNQDSQLTATASQKRLDARRLELRLLTRLTSSRNDNPPNESGDEQSQLHSENETWLARLDSLKRDSGLSDDDVAKLEDAESDDDNSDDGLDADEPAMQPFDANSYSSLVLSDSDSDQSDGGMFDDDEQKDGGVNRRRKSRKELWEKRNEVGETPLHVASGHGQVKRVRALIEQGHPVDVRDAAGWTPLHDAAWHGHIDCVEVLLDSGAPIDDCGPANERRSREPGSTALCEALAAGNLHVARLLIARGADVSYTNQRGETALESLYLYVRDTLADDCCCDAARLADLRDVERLLIERFNARTTTDAQKRRSRLDEVIAEARNRNTEPADDDADNDKQTDRCLRSRFPKHDDVLANPIRAYRDAVQSVGRRTTTASRDLQPPASVAAGGRPNAHPSNCFDFGAACATSPAVPARRTSAAANTACPVVPPQKTPFVGLRARGYGGFEDDEELNLPAKRLGVALGGSSGPPAKRPCPDKNTRDAVRSDTGGNRVPTAAANRPVAYANAAAAPKSDVNANRERDRDKERVPNSRHSFDSLPEVLFDQNQTYMDERPSAQSTQQSTGSSSSRSYVDCYSPATRSLPSSRPTPTPTPTPTRTSTSTPTPTSTPGSTPVPAVSTAYQPVRPTVGISQHTVGLSPFLAAQINALHTLATEAQAQAQAITTPFTSAFQSSALAPLQFGVGLSEPAAPTNTDRVVLRLKVRVCAPVTSSLAKVDEQPSGSAPTFMIPVREADATRTFDWLVNEIRVRFFREFAEKAAELKLCTADGCLVSAADRLCDILPVTSPLTPGTPNASGELVAHVIAWESVPLADRYAQLCTARGAPLHRNFAAYLAKAETTRDGRFAFVELRSLPPAFAQCVAVGALEHRFRRLEFDSNKLADAGFELLLRGMVDQLTVRAQTRPRLAESAATDFCISTIAVRNNQLSCRALRTLDEAFTTLSIVSLEQLELSGNDFADASTQTFWSPLVSLIGRSRLTRLVFRRCALSDTLFLAELPPVVTSARCRSLRFDFGENACSLHAAFRFVSAIVTQYVSARTDAETDTTRYASQVEAVFSLKIDEQLAQAQSLAANLSNRVAHVSADLEGNNQNATTDSSASQPVSKPNSAQDIVILVRPL